MPTTDCRTDYLLLKVPSYLNEIQLTASRAAINLTSSHHIRLIDRRAQATQLLQIHIQGNRTTSQPAQAQPP